MTLGYGIGLGTIGIILTNSTSCSLIFNLYQLELLHKLLTV